MPVSTWRHERHDCSRVGVRRRRRRIRRAAVLLVAGRDVCTSRGRRPHAVSPLGAAGTPADVPRPHDRPEGVALKIAELHGRYNIRALAFDRWRIEDIKRELVAIGCNVELVPFGQGFKDISPAVDVLERLVEEGKLLHGGHPVLTMAAANAKVELDAAGNRKLSKREVTGRIDPLVALSMALGVAARPAPVIRCQGIDWVTEWRSGLTRRNDGSAYAVQVAANIHFVKHVSRSAGSNPPRCRPRDCRSRPAATPIRHSIGSRSLCESCHNRKTRHVEQIGKARRPRFGAAT